MIKITEGSTSKIILFSPSPAEIINFSNSMKMAVSWDAALCTLVDTELCFREDYCLHHQGQYLQDYMVQHPGRLPSSYLLQ
jgi:hypothetical protein